MNNIFDGALNGGGRTTMYRSWVFPDVFPDERPPVLSNWHQEDLEAYCGGEFVSRT